MDQPNELEEFLERVRSLLGPNPPAVGPGEVEAILELARVAAPAVADSGLGPLAALAAALDALEAEHVLVLAADHPGLRVPLLAHLVALAGEADAVACRRGPRLEPLVAVYRRAPALAAARSRLAGPPGGRSLSGLLAGLRTLVVEEPDWRRIDPDGRSFADLDDPADLAAWDPGPR